MKGLLPSGLSMNELAHFGQGDLLRYMLSNLHAIRVRYAASDCSEGHRPVSGPIDAALPVIPVLSWGLLALSG
jgi:hypothetical protein